MKIQIAKILSILTLLSVTALSESSAQEIVENSQSTQQPDSSSTQPSEADQNSAPKGFNWSEANKSEQKMLKANRGNKTQKIKIPASNE